MVSKENYEARRDKIKIQWEMLAPPSSEILVATGKKIELFRQIWGMASMEDKRDIVRLIFDWIEIDIRKSKIRFVSPKRGFYMFFYY